MEDPEEADLNLYAYVSGHALKAIDPLGLQETDYRPALRDLGGPQPPPPPGTSSYGGVTVQHLGGGEHQSSTVEIKTPDARAAPQPAPSRPGSRPGEEVLGLLGHVGIGAVKGTALGAGVATGCAATGPGAPACMAAAVVYGGYSLWRDREKLVSDPYEAAETIGTFATIVPSAKFTRAQLASVPEHALFSGPKGAPVPGTGKAAGRAFPAKVRPGQPGPPKVLSSKAIKKSDATKVAARSGQRGGVVGSKTQSKKMGGRRDQGHRGGPPHTHPPEGQGSGHFWEREEQ